MKIGQVLEFERVLVYNLNGDIMSNYEATAKSILHTLNAHGYDAYFVGGYVRDMLLNRTTKDIDITTSARPEEVMAIFDNVKETGKRFGTVTVLKHEMAFEVTTFRAEGTYSDHRRPDTILFSDELEQDVKRRDFTINALCMDLEGNVIDLVDGKTDLKNHCLRMIGDPTSRLKEDVLRALRAIRFVSSHDFEIEAATLEALKEAAPLIQTLPIERIMQELNLIFKGPFKMNAFKHLLNTTIAKYLYGLEKGLKFLVEKKRQDLSPIEVYMVCFIVDYFDDVWRFSNQQKRLIDKVMQLHLITREDTFNTMMVFSHGIKLCSLVNKINVILGYDDQTKRLAHIDDAMPIKDVCDLAFKGQDIMQLTALKSHRLIGLVIDDLLEQVLYGRLTNQYDVLKAHALKKINKLNKELGENNE
jgi:tRNA nucleotidyltransferase (CCA-adding enzyme)